MLVNRRLVVVQMKHTHPIWTFHVLTRQVKQPLQVVNMIVTCQ